MMNFNYRCRDPLGNEHDGTVEAVSLEDAQQQLEREGFRVLKLTEGTGGVALLARRIGRNEIIYVTSQLAIMVDTGITLSVALQSIVDQEENPTLRELLVDLKKSVEGGESFSAALEKHPKYFDVTFTSLVRASESTGSLGEMLDRIAGYLRRESETRSKVRAAMAYPGVMAVVAVGVTIFLLTFVLPKFEPLFSKKGADLPKVTKLMMAASDALLLHWPYWVAGAAALLVGFLYARRTPRGREAIDWLKIHVPVLGPLTRKVAISRSVRTLGTMVASGVSVLEAIQLSGDVAGNVYYKRLWDRVLDDVTSGNQIYETLAKDPLFPPMLVQMIKSGEETAKLDFVLERVSTYYDSEVDMAIKTATSMIEPIMIVVMGVLVGGIAMALLLPIFTMGRPTG